jgi:hypothetical protein
MVDPQKPDPTEAVKEALTLAIKNLESKIIDRFEANEKAVTLARQELKDQIIAINQSIAEKFVANKDLVDQLAKANAVALSAALSTQKESAAKSEGAIGELLKQLQLNYEAANKAIVETLNRLTSRMDTGEAGLRSAGEQKQERSVDKGQNINMVAAAIAFFGILITTAIFLATRN